MMDGIVTDVRAVWDRDRIVREVGRGVLSVQHAVDALICKRGRLRELRATARKVANRHYVRIRITDETGANHYVLPYEDEDEAWREAGWSSA